MGTEKQPRYSIEDLPDRDSKVYSEKITICITPETKRKIEHMRVLNKKKISSFIRRVVDDAFEDISV